MIILLHVLVAAIYGATAWARWPQGDPPPAPRRNAGQILLALALVLHAVAIWRALDMNGQAALIRLYLEKADFHDVQTNVLADGRSGDPLVTVEARA